MAKLTYTIDGEDHTVEVTDSCSIGRAETNTIALESETGASRRHCQILKLSSTYELTDVGSTNGTKVNGKKVDRHRLAHGDRIEIGETLLVWAEHDGADVEEEIDLGGGDAKPAKASGGKASGACYLVFAGGDKDGERVQLDKSRVTFGRKPSNVVTIESAAVSGYHCEITKEAGGYVLRDLGSTNGTLLDGEPVTESGLQHGGRIRVGDANLVFVDPSVSDFEKAMASVDDLGSEWGMLRAEMDMSRVQRARRSQVVAVIGVVVVVGALGYVLMTNPDILAKDQGPQIEAIEGNLIEDFSFEELAGGWTPLPSSPVQGGFAGGGEGDAGKQGVSYYSVERNGPAGVAAVVETSEKEFTIRPGSAYSFGGHVKAQGGAQGCLRVRWIGAGTGVGTWRNATPLVSAGDWTVSEATAVPPANATAARLEMVNAGGGAALFDDVWFKPAGSAGGEEASSGALKIAASADGALTISRDGTVLLTDLRVVGGAFGEAADTGARPPRAGSSSVNSVSGGGSISISGTAYDAYADASGAFSVKASVEDDRFFVLECTLPANAGVVGLVPEALMQQGVGVWTASGSFRETETRFSQGTERVSIGDLNRYEVAAGAPFRFGLLADEGGRSVGFGLGDGGSLTIRIDTDTAALNKKRGELLSAAQDAEAQRRYAEAIQRYDAYAAEFPAGDANAASATERARELEGDGTDRLSGLVESSAGAIRYREPEGLAAAAAEAVTLRDAYGLAEAEEIRKNAEAELAKLHGERMVAAARPLLAKANDYRSSGHTRLARAVYEDVRARFPGTDAANQAETALGELGQ